MMKGYFKGAIQRKSSSYADTFMIDWNDKECWPVHWNNAVPDSYQNEFDVGRHLWRRLL
jgi:hypothetical protein